jgi:hypothetical protein
MFSELLYDYSLNGCLWRDYWGDVENRHVAFRAFRIVRGVYPGVDLVRLGMPRQIEDFDNTIPYRFALELFGHRNAFQVPSRRPVQIVDHAL